MELKFMSVRTIAWGKAGAFLFLLVPTYSNVDLQINNLASTNLCFTQLEMPHCPVLNN